MPPELVVAKATEAGALLHTTRLFGSITWPEGFTVMVKVCEGPVQPADRLVKVGITVMVATTGAVVVFVAVKEVISPVPVAPNPMLVVLFDQL